MNEIISERGLRHKIFQVDGGLKVARLYVDDVHYEKNGQLQDVNVSFKDNSYTNSKDEAMEQYLIDENRVTFGFRKDGKAEKYFGIRFGSKQMEFTPISVLVDGAEILPETLLPVKTASADIEFVLNNAVSLVTVVNSRASKTFFRLSAPVLSIYFKQEVILTGILVKNDLVNGEYQKDENGGFVFIDSVTGVKLTTFLAPSAWDSASRRFEASLEHRLYIENGKLIYEKFGNNQTEELLQFGVYPVYVDAPSSYYSTAEDGYLYKTSSPNWGDCRDAASADSVTKASTLGDFVYYNRYKPSKGNAQFSLKRAFFEFQTNVLGPDYTVVSATLQLYCEKLGDNDCHMAVMKGTQGVSLTVDDWQAFVRTYYTLQYVSNTSLQWVPFVFNATGVADVQTAVTASANTYISLQEYDFDWSNVTPSSNTTREAYGGYFESSSFIPYLELVLIPHELVVNEGIAIAEQVYIGRIEGSNILEEVRESVSVLESVMLGLDPTLLSVNEVVYASEWDGQYYGTVLPNLLPKFPWGHPDYPGASIVADAGATFGSSLHLVPTASNLWYNTPTGSPWDTASWVKKNFDIELRIKVNSVSGGYIYFAAKATNSYYARVTFYGNGADLSDTFTGPTYYVDLSSYHVFWLRFREPSMVSLYMDGNLILSRNDGLYTTGEIIEFFAVGQYGGIDLNIDYIKYNTSSFPLIGLDGLQNFESLAVSESVTAGVSININVFEDVAISEQTYEFRRSMEYVFVQDVLTNIYLTVLNISVRDSVAVVESSTRYLDVLFVSVRDNVSFVEYALRYLDVLNIDYYDNISLTELSDEYLDVLNIQSYENIGVAEVKSLYLEIGTAVHDTIGVIEWIYSYLDKLFLSLVDVVEVSEDYVFYFGIRYIDEYGVGDDVVRVRTEMFKLHLKSLIALELDLVSALSIDMDLESELSTALRVGSSIDRTGVLGS